MKKILALSLALTVILSLIGCSISNNEIQEETLQELEGTWKTYNEKMVISGSNVEITGYYELDGQNLPGVVEVGKVTILEDGSIEISVGEYKRLGYLKDENTLILDDCEYLK